jgi:vancomycin resistance protein YoaR
MTLDSLYDDVDWQEPSPPGRGRWPLVIGGVLLGLLVLYVAVAAYVGDRVPRGTTVAGVAVGGQDADQARATLTDRLGSTSEATVVLTSGAGKVEAGPADLGVAVDVDATVDDLVGFSLAPTDVWHHLVGGSAQRPVVTLDDDRFAALVERSRGELDAKPVEGSISLAGGKVTVKEPVAGTRTDVAGTADAVRRWWPIDRTVQVAARTLAPRMSSEELERVRAEFADVAVSGPVTVNAGQKTFALTPEQLAPVVVLKADEQGRITPRADDGKLRALVHDAAEAAGAEVEAKDAVVTFSGRTPTVKPHVSGLALDDASITTEVWKAVTTTNRTATVATTKTEPKFTTAVARKTLPKEKISSFTTNYQPGQPRVHNIRLASRLIDGTYVPPGEQFSMNGILGERTAGKGYVEAGIIRGGRAAKSYGGGISQVSTTIFNAAFFAGVQLDAWTPHYYYISRYPEGREATISWPDLHNKFTNTTDGGILVQVATTDTSITVTFWGTKKYDVTATKSARYDIVQPKRIVDDGPDCIDQTPVVGFKVDVGRVFKQGGKVVRTQKFTTNYRPEDDVTCTNPKP